MEQIRTPIQVSLEYVMSFVSSKLRLRRLSRLLSQGRLHRFEIDLDIDPIADHHAASLKCHIPVQSKILAIDRPSDREAGTPQPERILLKLPCIFRIKSDLPGDSMHRQVPGHFIFLAANMLNSRALKSDLREFFHVEEIWRT